MKKVLLGVVGFLFIAFVIGVLFSGDDLEEAAIEGRAERSATSNGSTQESNQNKSDNESTTKGKNDTYGVGDTVNIDGLKLTLESASLKPGDSDMDNLILNVAVSNDSNSEQFVSSWDFELSDANGYMAEEGIDFNASLLSATVKPGKKAKGSLIYEVDASSEYYELFYTPDWFSDDIVFKINVKDIQ